MDVHGLCCSGRGQKAFPNPRPLSGLGEAQVPSCTLPPTSGLGTGRPVVSHSQWKPGNSPVRQSHQQALGTSIKMQKSSVMLIKHKCFLCLTTNNATISDSRK